MPEDHFPFSAFRESLRKWRKRKIFHEPIPRNSARKIGGKRKGPQAIRLKLTKARAPAGSSKVTKHGVSSWRLGPNEGN